METQAIEALVRILETRCHVIVTNAVAKRLLEMGAFPWFLFN